MSEPARLEALSGSRFVATLAVVLQHFAYTFGYPAALVANPHVSEQALTYFFIHSGFILTYRYPSLEGNRADDYLFARVCRVWPMHLLALALYVALVPLSQRAPEWEGAGVLAANAALVQDWVPNVFLNCSFNGVAWSLSAEVFLYLAFVLMIAQWSRRWRWWLAGSAALTAALVLACSRWPAGLPPGADPWSVLFYHPLTRVCEFALGMALAVLRPAAEARAPEVGSARGTALEVGLVALAAAAALGGQVAGPALVRAGLVSAVTALWLRMSGFVIVPYAAVVLALSLERGVVSRALKWGAMAALGESTLCVYLVHFPLMRMCRPYAAAAGAWPGAVFAPLFLAGCVLAGHACWAAFDRPVRRALRAWWARRRGSQAGSAAVALSRRLAVAAVFALTAGAAVVSWSRPAVPPLDSLARMRGRARGRVDVVGTPVVLAPHPLAPDAIPTGVVEVTGWAADPRDARAVLAAYVTLDGGPPVRATAGWARPDVARLLGGDAFAACGLAARVWVGDLAPGAHALALHAVFADGYETVDEVSLSVPEAR